MAEVKFGVEDNFWAQLKKDLGHDTDGGAMRDAITLLGWARDESKAGRLVLSAEQDGTGTKHVIIKSLENIRPAAPATPISSGVTTVTPPPAP